MKYLTLFILFIVLSSLFPSITQAHILITDEGIGAVVHINPDDDPIVDSLTSFFFEFKDQKNKFQPKLCDCRVVILEARAMPW